MDELTQTELRRLTAEADGPCVSIYMPTYVAGTENQQNPLRLKNLLQETENRLVAEGARAADVRRWLEPARALLTDSLFWQRASEGLAVFLTPDSLRTFHLPKVFDESLIMGATFHVKPLLSLVAGDDAFYLLALSQNGVRLYSGTRHDIEPMEVVGLPKNLEEALHYDEPQEAAQSHSSMAAGAGSRKQTAAFHGQGGRADDVKSELESYLRTVDAAVAKALHGERAPLAVACVDSLFPIYRDVNTYPYLAEEAIKGNTDYMSITQLHELAWPVVEQFVHGARNAVLERFRKNVNTPRVATDLPEIIPAAAEGRVEALFLIDESPQWGVFDVDTHTVSLHIRREPGDRDLVELAVAQTLANSGSVYTAKAQDVGSESAAAALLRY